MGSSSPANLQVNLLANSNPSNPCGAGTFTQVPGTCLNPPTWTAAPINTTNTNVCFSGLTPGTTYWMVFDNQSGSTTDITLSATSGVVLPVKLVNFVGTRQKEKTELAWQTTASLNNSQFIVQRSFDGITFVNIGSLNAQNLSSTSTYHYTDNTTKAQAFYRLKINEIGGSSMYSNVLSVKDTETPFYTLDIFPNPTSGDFVTLPIVSNKAQNTVTYQVFDMQGKILNSQIVKINIGENIVKIPVQSLASSTYFVAVKDESGAILSKNKFVKN
jgi:hypothetical protein